MHLLLALREKLSVLLYPETLRFLLWLTGALIVISVVVRIRATLPMDRAVTRYLQKLEKPGLTGAAKFFTFLGNSSTIIGLAIVSIILGYVWKEPRPAWFLLGSLMALPINAILKKIMSRERPGENDARIHPGPRWGHSYPSGHSMGSAAFFSFLGAMVYMYGGQPALAGSLAILPILVGLSRIYLGAHWLSDVVGGWAGGLIVAVSTMAMYRPQ